MEELAVDINYKKEFNDAYWLRKGDPKLFDQVVASIRDKESTTYNAYTAGGKQADIDKLKQQLTASRKKGRGR